VPAGSSWLMHQLPPRSTRRSHSNGRRTSKPPWSTRWSNDGYALCDATLSMGDRVFTLTRRPTEGLLEYLRMTKSLMAPTPRTQTSHPLPSLVIASANQHAGQNKDIARVLHDSGRQAGRQVGRQAESCCGNACCICMEFRIWGITCRQTASQTSQL